MRNVTTAPIRDGSVLVAVAVELFGDELPIVGERQYLRAFIANQPLISAGNTSAKLRVRLLPSTPRRVRKDSPFAG
jgi:hypothetical protein